jgi:argininosuccinate lyase
MARKKTTARPPSNLPEKPWGGRFTEPTEAFVERFTASVAFDRRLYAHDIRGSIAHVRMLAHAGIVTKDEAERIVAGLEQIRGEIERGELEWRDSLEDVHMHVESRLIAIVGEVGKKLHTARSRNDQVATDIRLWLRDEIDRLCGLATELLRVLVDLAGKHTGTMMPGFTHLQVAQPITFGHHVLAWFEMLHRDRARLLDCRGRVDVLPLGAGALAGTTFPIDREFTARELGFAAVAENSIDTVADRDFAIEFCAAAALAMTHFSRWCEELVLWSSQQFAFIELPDRFCTGSSMMPQKKNPDVPELIRGKSGRVIGNLVSLLTLMKAQPLAYNKDNQEDKEPLFDAVDTLSDCMTALVRMLPAIEVNEDAMRAAVFAGFATATDLADYLVRKAVPFRDAHAVVGSVVQYAIGAGKRLDELSLAELTRHSPAIEADVMAVLTPEGSLAARRHRGGTAPRTVKAAVAAARARI